MEGKYEFNMRHAESLLHMTIYQRVGVINVGEMYKCIRNAWAH